jgi:hypothetical protein
MRTGRCRNWILPGLSLARSDDVAIKTHTNPIYTVMSESEDATQTTQKPTHPHVGVEERGAVA